MTFKRNLAALLLLAACTSTAWGRVKMETGEDILKLCGKGDPESNLICSATLNGFIAGYSAGAMFGAPQICGQYMAESRGATATRIVGHLMQAPREILEMPMAATLALLVTSKMTTMSDCDKDA